MLIEGWRAVQAVGPVAVTSLLLGSNLADVAGVTFPATVFSTVTNKTVPYNPNTPFEYAPQQTLYNNAAHNVRHSHLQLPTQLTFVCTCLE